MSAVTLKPEPWVELSPTPWWCDNNGVVMDAEGSAVCVLDDPLQDLSEQAIRNGALIVVAPQMLEALKDLVLDLEVIVQHSPQFITLGISDRLSDARAVIALAEQDFETASPVGDLSGPVILDEFAYDPAGDAAEQVP